MRSWELKVNNQESSAGDHFLHSPDLNVGFKSDIVRRN